MFDLASGQAEASQVGVLGENAFFQEAVVQFKADIRIEVFQVEPAGDPGPPKPQPMRVRVGQQPPTQDVADHPSAAGPGLTPRPHRGLVNRLITGQIEQFPPADMIGQRLLHRGQLLIGPLSDHTRTLDAQRCARGRANLPGCRARMTPLYHPAGRAPLPGSARGPEPAAVAWRWRPRGLSAGWLAARGLVPRQAPIISVSRRDRSSSRNTQHRATTTMTTTTRIPARSPRG